MSENFYTAYLMGGLGNQMFQIAHTLCQGQKHNVRVSFDLNSHIPHQGNQPNTYVNNIFRNVTFQSKSRNTIRISENNWNDSKLIFDSKESIEFYGYFQSSKNFLGYDNFIKEFFQPTDEDKRKIFNLYPELELKNTVSIHVRRGDYSKFTDVLPITDISYFKYVLNLLPEKTKIFIFSDDKNWVKENFKSDNQIIVDGLSDYEELWMMSLCNHNIMSNSSFSWWGSFLNKDENKKVFVPSLWFGPNGPNPHDSIYESYMNKINVKYNLGYLKHE
jgi:hypothetical protein